MKIQNKTGINVAFRVEGDTIVLFEPSAPPGHILTDDGVVRKVLGDLPITKDGMVIGDDCEVFYQGGSVRAECFRSPLPGESDWYPYHPHKAWSTREAAEAASKEVRGGCRDVSS